MTDDDIYKYKYLKYKSKYFNLIGGFSNESASTSNGNENVFIASRPDDDSTITEENDLASVNTIDTSSSDAINSDNTIGTIRERAARLGGIERRRDEERANKLTAERMKEVGAETGVSEELRKKRAGVTTRLRELLSADSDGDSSSSDPITRSGNRVDTGSLSRLLNSQNQSQTDYTRYETMLKRGVPEDAVRQSMTMAGLLEQQINDFFTNPSQNQSQNNETQDNETQDDETQVLELFRRFNEYRGNPVVKESIVKCLRQELIN